MNVDFQNTQGIIFVVDSNDRDRVAEAREERECWDLRDLRVYHSTFADT